MENNMNEDIRNQFFPFNNFLTLQKYVFLDKFFKKAIAKHSHSALSQTALPYFL